MKEENLKGDYDMLMVDTPGFQESLTTGAMEE
jgi:hypothetical protein